MPVVHYPYLFVIAALLGSGAHAQPAQKAQQVQLDPATALPNQPMGAPAPLVVYFDTGSTVIRQQDTVVLDLASRAYSEGKPIIMILTGTSDRVGSPHSNLTLSERRAMAVLRGLLDRGIPAERFQVLAKGLTDPLVPTPEGVAEAKNRRVEITWR